MTKIAPKRNKKEEQKKLAVRIVCMVLVVALAVTSLLAMFPSLFQQDEGVSQADIQAMLDAGLIYLGEDGYYYFTEDAFTVTDPAETTDTTAETDTHDHE